MTEEEKANATTATIVDDEEATFMEHTKEVVSDLAALQKRDGFFAALGSVVGAAGLFAYQTFL